MKKELIKIMISEKRKSVIIHKNKGKPLTTEIPM